MRSSFIGLTIMTKGRRTAHALGASFPLMSARLNFWVAALTVSAALFAPGLASAAPFGFAPARPAPPPPRPLRPPPRAFRRWPRRWGGGGAGPHDGSDPPHDRLFEPR